ncbi:MAG: CheR family methyltransferase [Acidimicrobiales bacterium]
MTTLTEDELSWVRELMHRSAALVLEPGKGYLVESRLGPIARDEGLLLSQLISKLRAEEYGPLHQRVVQAMTTNETSWFRDLHPFDALRTTVVPTLIERRRAERSLTIWSAACSTGQEPYSIAMVLLDAFPELSGWRVQILATDLSEDAVERGRLARYSQMEVNRGLSAQQIATHFDRIDAGWQVSQRIRSMVRFGVVNLVGAWPQIPAVDVVMLRNVMIYFDLETKRKLLDRIHGVLRTDGYLFLGNTESTLNIDDRFVRVAPNRAGCYQLRSCGDGPMASIHHSATTWSRPTEGTLT